MLRILLPAPSEGMGTSKGNEEAVEFEVWGCGGLLKPLKTEEKSGAAPSG